MISAVNSSASTLSVASILQTATSKSGSGVSSATSGDGDAADLSGPAKLFASLKELASEDPTKFKAVASDIAAKLKAAAGSESSATGGTSRLSDLADKFAEAAQTGDASVLAPPSGGPGGTGGYDRAGRPQGPPPGPPPSDSDSSSGSGTDLKSLFDSISKEVTDALAA